MFFLAATLDGWIGVDFVYRKVAAKNILEQEQLHNPLFAVVFIIMHYCLRSVYCRLVTDSQNNSEIEPNRFRPRTQFKQH